MPLYFFTPTRSFFQIGQKYIIFSIHFHMDNWIISFIIYSLNVFIVLCRNVRMYECAPV